MKEMEGHGELENIPWPMYDGEALPSGVEMIPGHGGVAGTSDSRTGVGSEQKMSTGRTSKSVASHVCNNYVYTCVCMGVWVWVCGCR